MTLSHQLQAIWWRNFILKKRGWFTSICDLSIPLISLCLLFYLYFKGVIGKEPGVVPEIVFPREVFHEDCLHYQGYSNVNLLYTNQNDPKVKGIMEYINRTNSIDGLFAYFKSIGFDSEHDMENWVLANVNESDYRQIAYGIVFNKVDEKEFSYKLRSSLPDDYPSFRSEDAGPDFYTEKCFLDLQKGLSEGFLKVQGKTIPNNIDLGIQRFPVPQYLKPGALWELLETVLTYIMFMSFMITTNLPVPKIVSEKETGAKELMRLMGIRREVLWGGWLMNMLTFGLVNVTYTSVLLKVQIKEDFSALLPKTNIILLWIVLVLFLVTMSLYALFFCCLFKKPLLANFVVTLAHLCPFYALAGPKLLDDKGKLLNILACIVFPQFNWSRTANLIVSFEKQYDGISFFNLFKECDQAAARIEMIWLLLSYLLSCVLYSILIWYFDSIMPGEYGIARPLYFPFQMCSRKKNNVIKEDTDLNETFFEKTGPNTKVGLSVRNLMKVFKGDVYAVNGVNLDVYDGQIMALLGHNGAGKTTTMSMITGMYSPSSGKIIASDNGSTYNIFDNMDKFRKSLGLCPQHNLVIPYLTVLEHLTFFGMLKGLDKRRAESDGLNWLRRFNILDKKNNFPPKLSGGMKRKLCLAISLVGDPKILILDEPTSGLDPESRRELWDSLLELRQNHTIIITTHFMEEADALGDRIAIMDHGKIICCGSPMFLKKLYGTGYNLQLLTIPSANRDAITQMIRSVIPNGSLKTSQQGQLTYSLPIEESKKFAELFESLEQSKTSFGITSIGISLTTMEEVFLRAGVDTSQLVQNDGMDEPDGNRGSNGNSMRRSSSTECSRLIHKHSLDNVLSQKKLSGLPLIEQHFALIFKKKFLCYCRSLFSNLIYLIIALACICVVGWTIRGTKMSVSTRLINLDLNDMYSHTKVVITYKETGEKYAELYNNLVPHGMERLYIDESTSKTDMNQTLLDIGRGNIEAYKKDYVIASSWDSKSATALYSGFSYHGSAISVNMLLNAIIKSTGLETTLSASYQALPLKQSQKDSLCDPMQKMSLSMSFLIFIPFGLLFFLGNMALFPLQERLNDAKQLQLMTGLSPITYWLAIFIWDLLMYAILMALAVGVLAIFDYPIGFVIAYPSLPVFVLLLSLFGLSGIVYAYFFTFLMSSSAAVSRFVTVNVFLAFALPLIAVILSLIPGIVNEFLTDAFLYAIRLIPPCCLGIAMVKFAILSSDHLSCLHCNPMGQCTEELNYFGWDEKHLSYEILFLGISFFIYVFFIALVESQLWEMIYEYITGLIYSTKMDVRSLDDDDADVKDERDKVDAGRNGTGAPTHRVMVVDGLAKRFGRFQAVRGVSFQVGSGECFGLLGVNGAGKTTTFKMLTGALLPTAGTAQITNYSLQNDRSKYLSQIGYCPQFDGINGLITARETLVLIGQLRGMPKRVAEKQAAYWIDLLGLTEYADRQCCNYSGGNKRKLSVGMALMADPVLLFLDEPTSGVDPVARRKLWLVLAKIQKAGQSVLLTSHSMDECEALCNRLTIMVGGQMKCIGNIQYLKQRFAQGFTAILKIQQMYGQHQLERESTLKQEFSRRFGSCEIISETIGTLQYHIKNTDIPWSQLFKTMDDLKNQFDIVEDYTISETTLEQVFISFAKEDRR
ncbi:phospholipid-transporting ATPase ABCA1 isoform X2 [Nilaparvata lugens]|uniref:phospholipid-transporting ATPase ABCA1 isoform X2 n=1 Tax=Nilaparvata lugens TaxID=108931 RepID=UPI00193E2BCE|nr:phospholipid-transporting ATPase ABCA1 isoform X2 [Nilaparvata lugens]